MLRTMLILTAVALPRWGLAASVFVNGVNVSGVVDRIYDNCRVQIDGAGNIYIITKDPNPTPTTTPTVTPQTTTPSVAGGPPTRRYWLVTEKAAPGMTQYDIDLFINAKWVRKFPDQEEHVVMEITKYLVTGKNKLNFVAKKNIGTARRSSSPQHYFRIVIGEGNAGGRNVMISKKAVDYKRTALETQDSNDEFFLEAQ